MVQDRCRRRLLPQLKMRNTPGVGLGLNLVSAIAKLHGFRLVIHPGPGGQVEIVCPDDEGHRAVGQQEVKGKP
jgi:signal transduction histidine kinase